MPKRPRIAGGAFSPPSSTARADNTPFMACTTLQRPVNVNRGVVMHDSDILQQAVLERIAFKIRQLRTDKHLTQERLCQKAIIAPRHLQKIENAQVNVTVHSLVKIANALEVDVSELLLDGTHR